MEYLRSEWSKKGEIDNLSKIVKPEIAIITNISEAHFENFNTLNDIAKAKAEIIDSIYSRRRKYNFK